MRVDRKDGVELGRKTWRCWRAAEASSVRDAICAVEVNSSAYPRRRANC